MINRQIRDKAIKAISEHLAKAQAAADFCCIGDIWQDFRDKFQRGAIAHIEISKTPDFWNQVITLYNVDHSGATNLRSSSAFRALLLEQLLLIHDIASSIAKNSRDFRAVTDEDITDGIGKLDSHVKAAVQHVGLAGFYDNSRSVTWIGSSPAVPWDVIKSEFH